MRRREFLAGAAGFAVVSGAESVARAAEHSMAFLAGLNEIAPDKYDRSTLPLPDLDFNALNTEQKIALSKKLVDEAFAGNSAYSAAFNALDLQTQEDISIFIFGRHELVIRFVRHTMMGWGPNALNKAQKTDMERFNNHLEQVNIHLGGWSELMRAVRGKKKEELYEIYKKITGLYFAQGEKKEKVADEEQDKGTETKEPPEEGEGEFKRVRNLEKPNFKEGDEIRPDVFVDNNGQEFSWGWERRGIGREIIKRKYYEEHENVTHTDLVPFAGVERNGKAITLELRKDAHDAWQNMVDAAKKDGIELYATEGFRTMEKQKRMRKRFGAGAAKPGYSEHHLGTTLDIREGNEQSVYKWLINFQDGSADHNFTPRAVEFGFVPTVRKESWHFRYVGKTAAKNYWKKNGGKIIQSHSMLLRTK